MDSDLSSQYVTNGDFGAAMVAFVFVASTWGSQCYQDNRQEFWESTYGKSIVVLCRLALSVSVMYYMSYVYLAYASPEHAIKLSNHARMYTYSFSEYLVHGFYLLMIVLCYLNLESFKYISPSIVGSVSISMIYPLLYIAMVTLFDASSSNWCIASFISMPEISRFLAVTASAVVSTLVDYTACTHLAHSKPVVCSKLS